MVGGETNVLAAETKALGAGSERAAAGIRPAWRGTAGPIPGTARLYAACESSRMRRAGVALFGRLAARRERSGDCVRLFSAANPFNLLANPLKFKSFFVQGPMGIKPIFYLHSRI